MAKKRCSGPCGKTKDSEGDYYSLRHSWCKECEKSYSKAKNRATNRLRKAHPKEYKRYLDEEMEK